MGVVGLIVYKAIFGGLERTLDGVISILYGIDGTIVGFERVSHPSGHRKQ